MHRAIIALALVILAGLGTAAGCTTSPQRPDADPSIRGAITSLQQLDGGGASLLVEGVVEQDTSYDKASVRVTPDTTIIADDGTAKDAGSLRTGLRVEIWFTGAVAESYPVQATADTIVILGE